MVTDVQVERYRRDGYLLLRGALPRAELAGFRNAARHLMARFTGVGDPYERVLHQIHLPWREDAVLCDLTTHPGLAGTAGRLAGMSRPRIFVDQLLCKPAGGAETIPHQDAPFLSFDDERSLNCWIALDEVSVANGALAYYRGSHVLGRLPLIHLDGPDNLLEWAPALAALPVDTLDMAAGDAVFHNCHTVHRASANATGRDRLAFSIQYMPADARFNGYAHDHLTPYRPAVGQVLDLPCFPMPRER